MRYPKINRLFAAIIALACFLPEVGLFVDGDILPKWYLFGLCLCAIVIRYGTGSHKDVFDLHIMKLSLIAVASLVSIWAIAESAFNGWTAARGPFDNPSGLAMSLSCVLALNMNNDRTGSGRKNNLLQSVLAAIMAFAVIASQSRCGIVALMLIAASNIFQYKRRFLWAVMVALLVSGTIGLSAKKSASTFGRAFILQQTWGMVAEHPLKGWGASGFERCYMLRQASFFERHPDSPAAMLADDIHHPLCEYLLWWVDYGFAGPLAIIILLFYPVFEVQEKGLRLASILICWFAAASYPLHYPVVWLTIILSWGAIIRQAASHILAKRTIGVPAAMIAIISCAGIFVHAVSSFQLKQAEDASLCHRHIKALRIYRRLEALQRHNPYYLYSYSRECYTVGKFEEALQLNNRCHRYWSNYDLELLRGDILFHLERYAEARQAYSLASSMCPVRFAPLEGLMCIFEITGDSKRIKNIAEIVIKKPIKIPSPIIIDIKKHAERIRQEYP